MVGRATPDPDRRPGPADRSRTGDDAERTIRELVGVYHADGSLRGELTYVVGKLVGRAHCALCDITHGAVRRRATFDASVATLPVEMHLVHLDERDADIAAASDGHTPCVLARTDAGPVVLLDADELERCAGDPDVLRREIDRAVAEQRLSWPT
jgi:hypothetical protein